MNKVGSVLVVGAGIGGMQAALDLASAGLKVYLVDNAPAIGGRMAQLDKTFPTNDCAMCILSPRLVEAGRHPNIEIITCADVERVDGEAGNFSATIHQHPRFVDLAKCTGCGDCATVCPVPRPDAFNAGLAQRKAIYKLYPQAIPNAYVIEKRGTAPCRDACPAHQRAQGYIALIRERRYADAYRVIKEDNPFPAICGRICKRFCEQACGRGKLDQPVAIAALKRFVADYVYGGKGQGSGVRDPSTAMAVCTPESGIPVPASRHAKPGSLTPDPGPRIAIIGSGPAGLTAARDLVRQGYRVTVFEALPVAGGMMRVGIPRHRLPPQLIEREIAEIITEGVELQLNTRVDDVQTLKDEGFAAVFVAVGAHVARRLPIPGADLRGVFLSTEILRKVNLGEPVALGKKVLVLGGGNVAMDVARSVLRLGVRDVHVACLESRDKMPADEEEIAAAEAEGVTMHPGRSFKRIVAEGGQICGVECTNVTFMRFEADGRLTLETAPGSEHIVPCDTVIFAAGLMPDLSLLKESGVALSPRRLIAADAETLATNVPGIFAGGDAVQGAGSVVEAIAAGHRAACSIHAYLNGQDMRAAQPALMPRVELTAVEMAARLGEGWSARRPRVVVPERPVAERVASFTEVDFTLSEEAAVAEAERCLACGGCSECQECVRACRAGAIDHNMGEQVREIDVGAVILAPGVSPLDGHIREEYGYGRYANVVTSLEFERMLSASGPWSGVVQRPSDGRRPHKVAFIQCVGSRDPSCGQGYCSAVCCMFATKEAVIAREHASEVEPTIFYMDVRAYGKDFDRYVERAQKEYGVRYVRSMISSVKEVPGNRNLLLRYVDHLLGGQPLATQPVGAQQAAPLREEKVREEEFDLVVLSLGLKPSPEAQAVAQRLGLSLNQYGFCETVAWQPTATSRPGIFVAGPFAAPKDIPETVIEASAAAAQASALLGEARGTQITTVEYPPEVDVRDDRPRVGVFVCHCGINIGSVVNVPAVVEYARTLPDVVYAEHNLYTCSQDTQDKIRATIKEHSLNRVVVASCTPRTHESLFQDTLRAAGLNAHLFEMTNIREQDAWVHKAWPEVATEKAKELLAMAVAKARLRKPLRQSRFAIDHRALVIGGGLAGMTAALSIADQGYDVHLIERSGELGGHLRHIYRTLSSDDPQALLQSLLERVERHERITVHKNAELAQVSGHVGEYRSTIRWRQTSEVSETEIRHGVIIVATGAQAAQTTAYNYDSDPRIITQQELEERLHNLRRGRSETCPESGQGEDRSQTCPYGTVVMIQCAGSRDDEHPYCSRVCCQQAIKNALYIKEINPAAQVFVLYRDMRAYGFMEDAYRRARELGVIFLPYTPEKKPVVTTDGGNLRVEVESGLPGDGLVLSPDLLVLSTGIVANDNGPLARLLKVPVNQDGFFLEAHAKLRPLDFAVDGIFLCGLAHSPRSIEETIAQAQGAAVRAVGLLSREYLEGSAIVAEVNERLCAGCGMCVAACPYEARVLDPERRVAVVSEALCQGCGACVAACPNGASQQRGFEKMQVYAMLEAM